MSSTLIIALCLFFVGMPFVCFLVIVANMALAQYREWKRSGRELEPIDRDFIRLCYVTLLIATALGGW